MDRDPSTVRLAFALAEILDEVRDTAERGHREDEPCPAARALQQVFKDLDQTDGGSPELVEMLLWGIVEAYEVAQDERRQLAAKRAQREQDQRERDDLAYQEAVRRHQRALTVQCPYCGAAANTSCVTAGPSGVGHPKGVHDHRDRYRAAMSILLPAAVNGAP